MNSPARTPEGRFVNPADRRMMFFRGFGAGAKMSHIEFGDDPDYTEAWIAGKNARDQYMEHIIKSEGLPAPNILRLQEEQT